MTEYKMTNYIGSKPVFADNTQAMLDLEAMIDAAGIRNVLHALEHIAFAKANFVERVWGDNNLAEAWRRFAHIASHTASDRSLDFFELWEVEGFIKRLLARNSENEERLVLEAITHLREFSKQETALRGRIWKLEAEIERLRNNEEQEDSPLAKGMSDPCANGICMRTGDRIDDWSDPLVGAKGRCGGCPGLANKKTAA